MTTQASIRPLFLAACILLVLCSPFLGMSLIHPSALLSPGSPDAEVFWRLRLPKLQKCLVFIKREIMI